LILALAYGENPVESGESTLCVNRFFDGESMGESIFVNHFYNVDYFFIIFNHSLYIAAEYQYGCIIFQALYSELTISLLWYVICM